MWLQQKGSTNLLKTEESRRLHVTTVVRYWRGACSMYSIHRLLRYVLNLAATHITPRRAAAGGLIALVQLLYFQPRHGTSRGIQMFRACATTRMQLAGRNVSSCKQGCASGLQKHLICTDDVTVRHVAKATYVCMVISYSKSRSPR